MRFWFWGMAILCGLPSAAAAGIPTAAVTESFRYASDCYELLETGAAEEAEDRCTLAIETGGLSRSNLAVTANNRGRAHLRLGAYRAAERDFTRAIMADPEYPHPYNNRALARIRLGDAEGARSDLDTALLLDPSYAHARYHRARLRRDGYDIAGALADLDAALRVKPDFEEARALRRALRGAADAVYIATADIPRADLGFMMALDATPRERVAEPGAAIAPPAQATAPAATELPDPEALAKASGIAAGAAAPALDIPDAPRPSPSPSPGPLPDRLDPSPKLEEFEVAFRRGAIDVRRAQRMLREYGYRPGPADGVYGHQTRRALTRCLEDGCPFSLR